jgi:hypothetical protein
MTNEFINSDINVIQCPDISYFLNKVLKQHLSHVTIYLAYHSSMAAQLSITFTVQCMLSIPHSIYCLLAGVILKQPTTPFIFRPILFL